MCTHHPIQRVQERMINVPEKTQEQLEAERPPRVVRDASYAARVEQRLREMVSD